MLLWKRALTLGLLAWLIPFAARVRKQRQRLVVPWRSDASPA